jgi:hypothetical protein
MGNKFGWLLGPKFCLHTNRTCGIHALCIYHAYEYRTHTNTRSSWKFEVTLRLTVSQSVCLGIEHPCGTCDQILLPVGMLLSEICRLVYVGRPLWREDEYVICSVICQWSESRRTHNHTLLSHLRLLGSFSVATYDSQVRWGEVTLRLTVSQSVCLGVGHPFGAHEQVCLFPFFYRAIALLWAPSLTRGWVCNTIYRWSESRRTHNRTLLSQLS